MYKLKYNLMETKTNSFSAKKFRKILNDLKRRPEDAAVELGISLNKIEKILTGEEEIDFKIIDKAVEIWPINHNDFFYILDDAKEGVKYFSKEMSDKTSRQMNRDGVPYYIYKDTVMSKMSPFRPEWIEEQVIVENSDPNNNQVKFNNGHFLHQFTYFIGPVNFYYMDEKNNKCVQEMNTGDSMYISPYVPHSFTTRKNEKNEKGLILALTYTDKIDNEVLNEINAIGTELSKRYKLDLTNKKISLENNIINFINMNSMTKEFIEEKIALNISDIVTEALNNDFEKLKKLSDFLKLNLRDLLPINEYSFVDIKKHNECIMWYLPNNTEPEYKIFQLANAEQLPYSKALELEVVKSGNNTKLSVPCHQYIYNIGNKVCKLSTEKKNLEFKPGDSCYLKPNVIHSFDTKSKLLILRIGGRVSGESLYHLSILNKDNFARLLDDNKPWFN